jgi:hypothetical protein
MSTAGSAKGVKKGEKTEHKEEKRLKNDLSGHFS